jgi:hypothetical protein
MADITNELNSIYNARFGRDMRYNIGQAIEKVNGEVEGKGTIDALTSNVLTRIEVMTKVQYDSITNKNPSILYVIKG